VDTQILVLVVEDEALLHMLLEEALTEGGFAVKLAAKGADAIMSLEMPAPDSEHWLPT
jgi:CheY-like chemotaxis protein